MNPPEQQSPVPASDAEHTGQRHPSATVSLLPPQQQTPRLDWTNKLLANRGAGPNARLRVRPRLTVAFWAGDVDAAAQVADKLVDNAVKHGMPFSDGCVSIRLRVAADTDDLEISVTDAGREFPDFDTVASAPPAHSGLWWVRHHGGDLTWELQRDDDGLVYGKTVTAHLTARHREATA
ncbi:ATP-binding protein [Streptomyces griseoaurantiacus]|uniref:ATP-binding protein n=1 Tax=Streptomyces griseoaurantiacus TaxID=68213 RepID=UPI0030E014B3